MSLFSFLRAEKLNAKVIMYALLQLFLLQFSSLARAVNIIFYDNADSCDNGLSMGCYNVNPYMCCKLNEARGGSVLINRADQGVFSLVHINGGCSTLLGTGASRGNVCYIGAGFTGAYWYGDTRRSLLADPTRCDTQMEPNSVIFTEDSTKGHWILTTPNVDQLYSEVQTVPDAEKANWLKSRGAIYDQL